MHHDHDGRNGFAFIFMEGGHSFGTNEIVFIRTEGGRNLTGCDSLIDRRRM